MTLRRISIGFSLLSATIALALAVSGSATAQDSSGGSVLRIGWAQDAATLNPFTGLDEEDYNVWAMNWDLLVNFDPKDLSPAPGIAQSWTVSDDKKTVTFKLDPDAKWSDGKPITSEDVKWSLEVLGDNGALFTNYTSNVTRIDTPDPTTVVIHTRRPDARIVGGLFIYILPKHIWGKVPLKDLTGTYKPDLPLVGSGPYIVTEYERGKIIRMERNPNFRGPEPSFDQIQYIKYGNQDAVERALQLGEVDMVVEVSSNNFARLGDEPNIETVASASPSYTELAFNLCPADKCPDAQFNPAVQDRDVRQAIAYAIDRERINTIAARDTSFPAHGILPEFYKTFYQQPEQDYPLDPEMGNQILDDAGWVMGDDGVRTKGDERLEFDLYVRSESSYNIQAAKLVAEEAKADRGSVQRPGGQRRQAHRPDDPEGRRQAGAGLRHLHLGLGRRPVRPELPAQPLPELGDRRPLRLLLRQPRLRPAVRRAGRDLRRPGAQGDHPEDGRDHPARPAVHRPHLRPEPAGLPHRHGRQRRASPVPRTTTGDIICEQVGYEPLLSITPVAGGGSDEGGGQSPGLAIVAAIVFGVGGWFLGSRQSRRREREPLEVEE